MKERFVFYKTCLEDEAEYGLPTDLGQTLYVGVLETDELFWYDNYNGEWHKSIHPNSIVKENSEFVRVKEFANGYVSIRDAIDYFSGILTRYEEEKNL